MMFLVEIFQQSHDILLNSSFTEVPLKTSILFSDAF